MHQPHHWRGTSLGGCAFLRSGTGTSTTWPVPKLMATVCPSGENSMCADVSFLIETSPTTLRLATSQNTSAPEPERLPARSLPSGENAYRSHLDSLSRVRFTSLPVMSQSSASQAVLCPCVTTRSPLGDTHRQFKPL